MTPALRVLLAPQLGAGGSGAGIGQMPAVGARAQPGICGSSACLGLVSGLLSGGKRRVISEDKRHQLVNAIPALP